MNILDIQEALKDFSEQQLIKEMQNPSGNAPQFLVLSELNRRKRMKADFQARQAQQAPTVAEALVASAGVPTQEMTQMSAQMAPSTDMAQNSGVMAMKEGGFLDSIYDFASDRYFDEDDEFEYGQALSDAGGAALALATLHPMARLGIGGAKLAYKGAKGIGGLAGRGYNYFRGFFGGPKPVRQSTKPTNKQDEAIQGAVEEKGMLSKIFSPTGLTVGGLGLLGLGNLVSDNEEGEPKTSPYGFVPDNQQGGFDSTPDARQQELQELYDEYDRLSEKSVRDADMNKYLALAAAGFQLMQPDEGGFAGAASKAGLAGLKTLQDADAAYNKAVTDRLATRIKLFDATKPKDKADQLAKIAKAISVLQTERERAIDDVTREQINRQIEMLVQQQQAIMGITQGQNVVTVN